MTTKRILGFGFCPEQSDHCFLVTLPNSLAKDSVIVISEHFDWIPPVKDPQTKISLNPVEGQVKAILSRHVWEIIQEDLKAEFNRRLRSLGLKTGQWIKRGQIPVDRTLGKELTLLAWAVEEVDPSLITIAIRNWLGLAPEERWWLYTMTNAASGHAIDGRNQGWRKAIRYALTENPVSGSILKSRVSDFELSLFNHIPGRR